MRLKAQRIQMTIRQNYDRSTAMWKAVGTLSRQGYRHLAHSRHGEGPLGKKGYSPGYFLRTFECFGCEHSTGEVLKVSIEDGLPSYWLTFTRDRQADRLCDY
jgi:hypothetical protein